jgi:hypothetical protein
MGYDVTLFDDGTLHFDDDLTPLDGTLHLLMGHWTF